MNRDTYSSSFINSIFYIHSRCFVLFFVLFANMVSQMINWKAIFHVSKFLKVSYENELLNKTLRYFLILDY